ncbi:MAG: universal stress protein [Burkholderiales bacterium]|nr:universal stress protein [Burkholderiales bacterium]
MFKNILVPTDGSALSCKAVKKAAVFAKKMGAKITGFHVAPVYRFNIYADYVPPNFESPQAYSVRIKKVAQRHLDVIKKAAAEAGVTCSCYYTTSDFPADAIVKAAKKYKCDVIFMASHGRTGLSRLLLGSETTKVLTHTKIPVLVYR